MKLAFITRPKGWGLLRLGRGPDRDGLGFGHHTHVVGLQNRHPPGMAEFESEGVERLAKCDHDAVVGLVTGHQCSICL